MGQKARKKLRINCNIFPLQILYNFYASLFAKPPCLCDRPIRLESEMRPATDDTRVYTFENDEYKLFRITKVDRNIVSVRAIQTEIWEPLYQVPSFGNVGIFKIKGEDQEVEEIAISDIKGKVIIVENHYAITIPKIILDEAI